jgi:hypothetical protein
VQRHIDVTQHFPVSQFIDRSGYGNLVVAKRPLVINRSCLHLLKNCTRYSAKDFKAANQQSMQGELNSPEYLSLINDHVK